MKQMMTGMLLFLVMGCLEAPKTNDMHTPDMGQDLGDTAPDGGPDLEQDMVDMAPECTCEGDEVCDAEGTCVQCLDDNGCAGTGVCEGGSCVACREGGDGCDDGFVCDVEADAPVCVQCLDDTGCDSGVCSQNECVTCTSEQGCQGDLVCNTLVPGGECVVCIDDEQCTMAGASVCDLSTNTCTGCDNPTQCEGFFESSICLNDTCVECEAATERDDCAVGGKRRSCLRDSNTCSDTELESVLQGMPCQADSECLDGACIELDYTGPGGPRELGGICLKDADSGCPQGWKRIVREPTIDGGSVTPRCGFNSAVTTPQAILDALGTPGLTVPKVCGAPTDCGRDGLMDASCLDLGRNTCTYACASQTECPTGVACFEGYCDL